MPSRRQLLTILGAAGTAGVAGCIGSGGSPYSPGTDTDAEWPMPAYGRGFSASNPDAAAPRDGATERWSTDVPLPNAAPVVAAGTVLVPTRSGLVALDVATGAERWRYGGADSRHRPTCSPVVHDGTAYVGSFGEPHGLVALDVETGNRQWHAPTAGFVEAAPTFGPDYDSLLVGDSGERLYRVDSTSGEVTDRGEVFGPVTAVATVSAAPSRLLVGTGNGELTAFHPDGDAFVESWRRTDLEAVVAIAAGASGNYVATPRAVYRLEAGTVTGSNRWGVARGAPGGLAAASRDVVGTDRTTLRTLDARTGDVGRERDGWFTTAPAVAGDTVYVGATEGEGGRGFVAADALSGGGGSGPLGGGRERWRFDVGSGRPVGRVAVADGAVVACTDDRTDDSQPRVYAIDPA